jgi:hypothetical protein
MDWLDIGASVLGKNRTLTQRTFKLFFKLPSFLASFVFIRLSQYFSCEPHHFLWTLHYLKTRNSSDDEIAKVLSTTRETLLLHVWDTLEKLNVALPEVFIQLQFFFSTNYFFPFPPFFGT